MTASYLDLRSQGANKLTCTIDDLRRIADACDTLGMERLANELVLASNIVEQGRDDMDKAFLALFNNAFTDKAITYEGKRQ